ncbi:MAG: SRPBCC domain-containing protein [Alphaproteobacteria bacterium]|nr:SRPBCC domain-containing protein [Alphaproteobacteria bacterium]
MIDAPVIIKRVMPCSKRQLFDAWSKPEVMSAWFFADQMARKPSTVKNSFTVGGHWELTMHLHESDPCMHGEYREINRYNRIVFTWNSHIANDSIVELDFREISPNRTEMKLTHTHFPSEESRASHINGWDMCLDSLAQYLDEG